MLYYEKRGKRKMWRRWLLFWGYQSVIPHRKLIWCFSFFFIQDWNSLDISSTELYLAISAWINCVIRTIWIQITQDDRDVTFTHVYVLLLLLIEFYTLDQQLIGNNCCFEGNLHGTVSVCVTLPFLSNRFPLRKGKVLSSKWLMTAAVVLHGFHNNANQESI